MVSFYIPTLFSFLYQLFIFVCTHLCQKKLSHSGWGVFFSWFLQDFPLGKRNLLTLPRRQFEEPRLQYVKAGNNADR